MTIKTEIRVRDFDFWMDARTFADKLTPDEWDVVEGILEILHPEGMTACELNDQFWFYGEQIATWLYTTEEKILARE